MEKTSEKEYMKNLSINKTLLTKETLKSHNKISKIVVVPVFLFLTLFAAIGIFQMIFNKDTPFYFFIPFVIFPVVISIVILKYMKKDKKENALIDNGEFKIVEDKIYDKLMTTSRDSDGDTHYHYYVFSKIYGEIKTDSFTYNFSQKDDSIYLLFYSGNEQNSFFENYEDECNRNSKIIDQEYLSMIYSLSNELNTFFIPYNKALGESNFSKRTKSQIDNLNEKKNKIKCKHCGKKYNFKKNDACPECGSINRFELIDVIHNEDWYS